MFALSPGTAALQDHADAWDQLAAVRSSPFLTRAWLSRWAASHPDEQVRCATLCDSHGQLLAGAAFRRIPTGLASLAELDAGDWDAVAVDDGARWQLWDEVAAVGAPHLKLSGLRVGSPETDIAVRALSRAGYGVLPGVREVSCPYVTLPSSFEELLDARSRNTRKQLRKRRRALLDRGRVVTRLSGVDDDLGRDFAEFLRVEASGWKGRQGTAVAARAASRQLYEGFAREAALQGWLRLYLLEVDGDVVAAQLAAAVGEELFLIKTGFDEAWAGLSPGFVLAADVLAHAIDEGLRGVDMQGRADEYKMVWADRTRPRQHLRLYRGPAGRLVERAWDAVVRPQLVALRDRARVDARLRGYLETAQKLFPSR